MFVDSQPADPSESGKLDRAWWHVRTVTARDARLRGR